MATDKKTDVTRRRFMRDVSYSAGTVVTLGFLFGLPAKQSQAKTSQCLPPPGALEGNAFAAACIRCGQCVQECPYDTLKLATASTGIAVGTPYFIARDIPCQMCEKIYCVEACPSGALDPKLVDIDKAKMGVAVLSDQTSCIAWQGLRCEICYNVCPKKDKAIKLERLQNPRTGVHALHLPRIDFDECTGCGLCEHACILDEAAIKVLPLSLVSGALGAHYRLGWEEKEKAGEALVPSTPRMDIRRPEEGES